MQPKTAAARALVALGQAGDDGISSAVCAGNDRRRSVSRVESFQSSSSLVFEVPWVTCWYLAAAAAAAERSSMAESYLRISLQAAEQVVSRGSAVAFRNRAQARQAGAAGSKAEPSR